MRMTRRACFGAPLLAVVASEPPTPLVLTINSPGGPVTDWTQENRNPIEDIRAAIEDYQRKTLRRRPHMHPLPMQRLLDMLPAREV